MKTHWNFAKGLGFKENSIFKGERKIPTNINWSSKLLASAKWHIHHIIGGPETKMQF